MLRALIVDDDVHMRFLVRLTIEVANEGLSVSGEADSGPAAILAVEQDRPEVIVLDHWMPGMSGLETARRILADNPEQRILLFSAALDDATIAAAHEAGITECLPKTEIEHLPETLRRVGA